MASFNDPKVTNLILNDVGTIQQLLSYLAQLRPDFASDPPTNSIRLVAADANATLYALQKYSGSAWSDLAELRISVTKLKGYVPSTSAAANTIPVYNASGQLVGNITGNAPTATKLATPRSIQVGGILSSTAINFDGTGNITIPVNTVTINNSADNAVNGVLSFAHGGTGRTDGASQDVVVSGTSSNFLAKAYGQLGQAKVAAAGVNVNSLIERGLYILQGNMTIANNLPENTSAPTFMEVFHQGNYINQIWHNTSRNWQRYSTNKGASFSGWYPIGFYSANLAVYISKSGSDYNNGLSSSYPVLTVARAMQIADGLTRGAMAQVVYLRFGEGNWDGLSFYAKPYVITIQPYDGANATAYSASLPVFTYIDFIHCKGTIGTVVVTNWARGRQCSTVDIVAGYKRFGRILAEQNSHVNINSQNAATNVLDFTGDGANPCIAIATGSTMYIGYHYIGLRANITAGQFLYVYKSGTFITANGLLTVALNGFTFTGSKFAVECGGFVCTSQAGVTAPAEMTKLPGTAAGTYALGAVVNGYSVGQAVDSAVVHKSGDTMTGNLEITRAGSPRITLKNSLLEYNITPSASQIGILTIADKNGNAVGDFYHEHMTSGASRALLRTKGQSGEWSYLIVERKADNSAIAYAPGPPASENSGTIATTAWVRTLLNSNSANEVPVGTVCYYTGTFTRAIDAAVYFARQIDKLDAQLKDEKGAARMLRMTRASEEETTEQAIALGELESRIFKLEFMKGFFLDMESRVPENDGVTLYDAAGDPIQEEAPGYPEFHIDDGIESYAFPNTKWNEYKDAAGRCLFGEGTLTLNGANHTFGFNGTGGTMAHSHTNSGTIGSYTLTVSTIPGHGHTYTGRTSNGLGGVSGGNGINSTANQQTGSTGSSGAHTHTLSIANSGNTTMLPPYKILRLIKKVA